MALRSCLWKCCCEHWRRAPVFVASGSTAVFWGASECLISLSCHPSFFFFGGVIFVFHSQLCSDKMALRSVSRSITDKAWLRGNFQPDQLGLSIVCPEYFGNKWPKLDSIFNTALRKKLTETLKSLSQITLVQPLAKFPKLSFKSGQGHYTYTGGGIPLLICFHFQKCIPFCLLYSQLDMTHLDTLVTSTAALSCSICHIEDKKRSHASRRKGSLSHCVVKLII